MATNFPGSLDSFTNPVAGDSLASPSHAGQHANVNDAVEAIETALLDGAPLHIDDANNRVGIGTTSPASQFHVDGGASGAQARITASGADTSIAFLTEDQQNWSIGIDESDAGKLKIGESVNVGTVTRVTIDSSGNVGINDASPSYTLDVNGDINATGDLRIGGTAIGTWTSWTPTFHGLDASTVSDATIDFQYARLNDLIFMIGNFTFGATVNVTGEMMFTTPVDCSMSNPVVAYATDSGTLPKNLFPFIDTGYNPSRIRLFTMQTNVTYGLLVQTSATIPITWATGDGFRVTAIGKVA